MTKILYNREGAIYILRDEYRVVTMDRVEEGVGRLLLGLCWGRTERSKMRIVEESFSGRFL
jgi:hypothetical protein